MTIYVVGIDLDRVGSVDQGEVPFLAVPKVQNSHPDSGIEPSAKLQGWGNLLANRPVGKIV